MPRERRPIRRGEIIGEVVSDKPLTEADHYERCPRCNGLVDRRDLGAVLEHCGSEPCPAGDRPQ